MKKIIFTQASPRAAQGIRRVYEEKGGLVTTVLNPHTGKVTVAVELPESKALQRARNRIAA